MSPTKPLPKLSNSVSVVDPIVDKEKEKEWYRAAAELSDTEESEKLDCENLVSTNNISFFVFILSVQTSPTIY